ncbi:nucleolar zinc-finger protein [Dimargaris xerosporica]|nr:nucleolar zinc-finger protein [Dimargaris xerosporica]
MASNDPIYVDIGDDATPTEIESYCMNCEQNGLTRLLLTKIPHFREVIVMAFECPHCGWRNNEIQSGSTIAEKGVRMECRIENTQDLNRQLVKSDSATIQFVEIDLEIPPKNGSLNTVEGLIGHIIEDLGSQQPVRKAAAPEVYAKIEAILTQLKAYQASKASCTVVVNDPAGNSYIENLCYPNDDPKLQVVHYERTREDAIALGMAHPDQDPEDGSTAQADHTPEASNHEDVDDVMTFHTTCSSCGAPNEVRMHQLEIPHFKEVIIMANSCDHCGFKSNEVKSGGAISSQGRKITLKVEDSEDLSRDILKSETCGLSIPEIDLELQPGTLGGRFTTVEGLLTQVKDELSEKAQFLRGDSSSTDNKSKFGTFLNQLGQVIQGQLPCTLILDDPLANSHLQNLYAPDPDPNMTVEDYDRTWEQNENLGLNDIKVENYEEEANTEQADS